MDEPTNAVYVAAIAEAERRVTDLRQRPLAQQIAQVATWLLIEQAAQQLMRARSLEATNDAFMRLREALRLLSE